MAFVLERAFSGLAAVTFKGARKDGMLTAFREPARKRMVTVVLVTEAIAAAIPDEVPQNIELNTLLSCSHSFRVSHKDKNKKVTSFACKHSFLR